MTRTWTTAWLAAMSLAIGGTEAEAQIDLSGMWAPIFHEDQVERIPGPDVGDYAGLPINDAARTRGLSWDASLLTLPEHQCKPHPSTYGFRGVGNLRIWPEFDDQTERLVKLNTHIQWQEQRREIWLDGRPHPPEYAAHTWQGFSTGHWDGSTLVVRTTHLKAGWMRRNGLPLSDRTVMTERFIRHGNLLTHVYMIEDPVYLTEPLVKTNGFQLTPDPNLQPYPCLPAVEVPRAKGDVPHHLLGRNPFADEFAKKHGLPLAATHGGAYTALPESMRGGTASPSEPVEEAPRASRAPRAPEARADADRPRSGEVRSIHVQGKVWMLVGDGTNAAVQIGEDGVLVVDTLSAPMAAPMIAEIRRLAGDKPIRWIINTHADLDHTGGNVAVAEAGESVVGGNFAGQVGQAAAQVAQIIAHENVQARMSQPRPGEPAVPTGAWPTETFFTDEHALFFNGEAVQLFHRPHGHTDGDIVVFFRRSDVLVAGDLFVTTTFPVVSQAQGGSLEGVVASLNWMIDVAVPKDKQEGGTYVIPGHGRLADEADVVEYRDMLTIIRDRFKDAIARGMTMDQVKAARLLRDYEGRYGTDDGPWTTDAFIEAAYGSLKAVRD